MYEVDKNVNDGKRYFWKADMNADRDWYMKRLTFDDTLDVTKLGWKGVGLPQPIITLDNGDYYRFRSELIIMNDKDEILLSREKARCFPYSFPGGGIDPGETIEEAAIRESKEEALVIPKNVRFVNIAWFSTFKTPILWKGILSFTVVGQYSKPYKGYVKVIDRDSFTHSKEWVNYKKMNLGDVHRAAIERYLSTEDINENASYVSSYDSFISRIINHY